MPLEFEWTKGREAVAIFLMLLAFFMQYKYSQFKATYEPYISGNLSRPLSHNFHIAVSYDYRSFTGEIEQGYYFVPSIDRTPEWQEIQLIRLLWFSILPWAVPKLKRDPTSTSASA